MKNFVLSALCLVGLNATAQIETPKLSPEATIKQKVGLTEIKIKYSRPSKRGRNVFSEVVPMGEIWRTGANENTLISINDPVVFGKDTLTQGKYAIYTKPADKAWEVYFYSKTDNWGTPDTWDEEKVVLTTVANVSKKNDPIETFTISIDNVTTKGATLSFGWDDVLAEVPFTVLTDEKVDAIISQVMSGPSSNDYYRAANYYLSEKKNLKQANEWMDKAIELTSDAPFWMLYRKALIEEELGNKAGVLKAAKAGLTKAQKAGHDGYIKRCQELINKYEK